MVVCICSPALRHLALRLALRRRLRPALRRHRRPAPRHLLARHRRRLPARPRRPARRLALRLAIRLALRRLPPLRLRRRHFHHPALPPLRPGVSHRATGTLSYICSPVSTTLLLS